MLLDNPPASVVYDDGHVFVCGCCAGDVTPVNDDRVSCRRRLYPCGRGDFYDLEKETAKINFI